MQQMIENLINGNLSDAREQAKGKPLGKIAAYCRSLGWSAEKAAKAAYYLKTGSQFQAYCDAK